MPSYSNVDWDGKKQNKAKWQRRPLWKDNSRKLRKRKNLEDEA